MTAHEGPDAVAAAAIGWIEATLADRRESMAAIWTHGVQEIGAPGLLQTYEHDLEGWTIRLTKAVRQTFSGYGDYFSSTTAERYGVVVVDPAGDVRANREGGSDSPLQGLFERVAEAHERQGWDAKERFLTVVKRAAPNREEGLRS